ncbi:MAG: hypothetical protein HYY90_02860 [Candidatus Omnitrophica bacterium]|nr:hypothetical protein [Candidatus Omnitrophota bacterium]
MKTFRKAKFIRFLLIGILLAGAMVLVSSLTLWIILSSWLPTRGKALVIQELERQGPVEVSIGAMRYRPLHGFLLDDVQVVDRATQDVWYASPAVQVQVDWLPFFFQRRLVFRSRSSIERPAQTILTVAGQYHLRERSLDLDVQTTEIPLRSVATPLTRWIPPSLQDGILRLQFHLSRSPHRRAAIAGRVEGTHLVWETSSWRLSGDLVVDGTAIPPSVEGGRWIVQGDVTLHQATLEGLPVGVISRLEGVGYLTEEHLEIRQLTGMCLGSLWALRGTMTAGAMPSFEVLLTSRANLAPLAAAFPTFNRAWQPEGTADVEAVCRGPLQPSLLPDCLAHAELRNATLAGAKLTRPLTGITGRMRYDLSTHTLSIDQLTGRLMDGAVTLSGEMDVKDPVGLQLHLSGTLPLEAATPWLPPKSPVHVVGGAAALDLEISGSSAAPRATGEVELREAAAQLTAPTAALERVTGWVRLAEDRITVSEATLTLNGEPLTLSATVAPFEKTTRLTATVGFPQGRLSLTSRVTPETVTIDEGRLALEKTQVSIRGRVGRAPDHPSTVDLSGTIELSELRRLPFLPLPQLDAWNLEGLATIEATFEGRFSDWPAATIQSRLRLDQLKVREIPLEHLNATLEQSGGLLRVRLPSGLCAEGKCWGELIVKHRSHTQPTTILLQADVVGLQLARLARAIPAWRSRSVTGSASAHAAFSGSWEQRPTWRGEGWLNASGERLGDLPLLDKLFRGLFGVLSDRLGLEALRRAQITQASVQWRLSQERFHTEDLRLAGLAGAEPVAVYAKGSVGLDRTLDFVIEPELSEGVVLKAPTTSTLAGTVLKAAGQLERFRRLIGRHRLTGTLDHPDYRFEFTTQEIFKQSSPAPSDLIQQLLDAVGKPGS